MSSGGIVDVGGERITNVGEPTRPDHAATKGYVDDNGGSQPIEVIGPIAVVYNDPDFVTGIAITEMNQYDILLSWGIVVTTAFDASTDLAPFAGSSSGNQYANAGTLNINSPTSGTDVYGPTWVSDGAQQAKTTHTLVVAPATPGADGQGAAVVFVVVGRAS